MQNSTTQLKLSKGDRRKMDCYLQIEQELTFLEALMTGYAMAKPAEKWKYAKQMAEHANQLASHAKRLAELEKNG